MTIQSPSMSKLTIQQGNPQLASKRILAQNLGFRFIGAQNLTNNIYWGIESFIEAYEKIRFSQILTCFEKKSSHLDFIILYAYCCTTCNVMKNNQPSYFFSLVV